MNENCCSFQSATGLTSVESSLNFDTYNASIIYTDVSSNNNFKYTSNTSNQLFNYSSNSSNDNFNFTLLLFDYYSNNSNIATSNVSNIYYNGALIDSNLLWYKYELFKTQVEVGLQKAQLTGMSLTDSLLQASITSHTVALADHGGKITDIQNNHYNKTSVNTLISNSSNDCYSNASNISFTYTNNTSNQLFDLYSNNSNYTYEANSNTSNSLFAYTCNTSNSLFDLSSNNSNSLFALSSNNSNSFYETNSNSSNSLFAYTSNTSNSLFALSSNNSNSLFAYTCNTSNSLFALSSNNSNSLYETNSNSTNSLFAYTCNTLNSLFALSSDNSNSLHQINSNTSNSLFAYTCNTSNSLFALSSNNSNSLSNLINTKQNKLTFDNPLSNFQDSVSIKTGSSISIDGSGNLGVVSSVQSKWTTNGTNIYNDNIGNIGIGATIPLYKLDVNGDIKTNAKLNMIDNGIPSTLLTRQLNLIGSSAVMKIFRTAAIGNPAVELRWKNGVPANDSDSTYWWDFYLGTSGNPGAANKFTIRDRSPNGVMANNKDRFTIDTNGNVIIGSAGSTTYKLDVSGQTNSSGEYFKNGMNISNIFVTSNVLSNTSNTLANYNNLYNKPDVFTKLETSNIFVTSNVLSNTSNTLANYDNLYNKPNVFTKTETSNIFVSSNVLSNTSNTLANYNNLYNKPDIFTKTETSNNFYTKTQINNSINTNLLLVGKTTADSPESILEVSDNFKVQKNAAAGDYINLSASYNTSIGLLANPSRIDLSSDDINLNGKTNVEKLFLGTPAFANTIVELSRNLRIFKESILPDNTYGDVVSLGAGDGLTSTGLSLSESGAAFLYSNKGSVYLTSISEDATITGRNIYLNGKIQTSGKIARKSPIFFTTNRTFTMSSVTYSAYDIDLSLYVNKVELDGFNHRHFRVRLFFANGRLDFQWTPTTYQIYMTTYNTLSIKAYSSFYGESQLDQPSGIGYFLYRNSIDKITFCASTFLFGSTVKVYFVFEDLL